MRKWRGEGGEEQGIKENTEEKKDELIIFPSPPLNLGLWQCWLWTSIWHWLTMAENKLQSTKQGSGFVALCLSHVPTSETGSPWCS